MALGQPIRPNLTADLPGPPRSRRPPNQVLGHHVAYLMTFKCSLVVFLCLIESLLDSRGVRKAGFLVNLIQFWFHYFVLITTAMPSPLLLEKKCFVMTLFMDLHIPLHFVCRLYLFYAFSHNTFATYIHYMSFLAMKKKKCLCTWFYDFVNFCMIFLLAGPE
jgi:hypothetical protein